ncbi:hypothetical protein MtrunA17_Chr4g0076391 [Medicago truncatula]|uniref:Uncharacterized protein n=1 Tax=Medicago truncatula TaxID=3880 RepID=A0A396IJS5_MEDTR|nr:hypothetical protein MtrunA17_Chr4g0076391 [Medicago truncatula]
MFKSLFGKLNKSDISCMFSSDDIPFRGRHILCYYKLCVVLLHLIFHYI